MNKRRQILYLFSLTFLLVQSCKKPYEPPAKLANSNYLVVDGFINTTPNGVTTIKLSRTRNLADTGISFIPELGANIAIENKSGVFYFLGLRGNDGTYTSDQLNLPGNDEFRLNIILSNGKKYISDFVRSKQTPPIDSVSWIQDEGVDIYVSTADPLNNTRYYKWDFTETIQYTSLYETPWRVTNGLIVTRDTADLVHICWRDQFNTDILIGSTAALSKDVVSLKRITTIPDKDKRLDIRYSILVRQYALTAEAYQYWLTIKKNSEQLGTLFDLQPSQLYGNIQSVSDRNEPVVGFVSAATVQQTRIFIDNTRLDDWIPAPANPLCEIRFVSVNPVDYRIYDYPDNSFSPWYFITGGPLVVTKNECLDCTLAGGTNKKPSFW